MTDDEILRILRHVWAWQGAASVFIGAFVAAVVVAAVEPSAGPMSPVLAWFLYAPLPMAGFAVWRAIVAQRRLPKHDGRR